MRQAFSRAPLGAKARAPVSSETQSAWRRYLAAASPSASIDRLRRWLGVDYETFYGHPAIGVAAMAFCFPGTNPKGGDFPPPARCAQLWRPRLLERLPNVELTLLVGGYAQGWALEGGGSMTDTVRRWREFLPHYLPLPHPSWRNTAWLKKNPWFEEEVTPWLRARVAEMLA